MGGLQKYVCMGEELENKYIMQLGGITTQCALANSV